MNHDCGNFKIYDDCCIKQESLQPGQVPSLSANSVKYGINISNSLIDATCVGNITDSSVKPPRIVSTLTDVIDVGILCGGKYMVCKALEDVSAGHVLSFGDASGDVIKCTASQASEDASGSQVFGIALNKASAGGIVNVAINGFCRVLRFPSSNRANIGSSIMMSGTPGITRIAVNASNVSKVGICVDNDPNNPSPAIPQNFLVYISTGHESF